MRRTSLRRSHTVHLYESRRRAQADAQVAAEAEHGELCFCRACMGSPNDRDAETMEADLRFPRLRDGQPT
jgi:hypothetical protein